MANVITRHPSAMRSQGLVFSMENLLICHSPYEYYHFTEIVITCRDFSDVRIANLSAVKIKNRV